LRASDRPVRLNAELDCGLNAYLGVADFEVDRSMVSGSSRRYFHQPEPWAVPRGNDCTNSGRHTESGWYREQKDWECEVTMKGMRDEGQVVVRVIARD